MKRGLIEASVLACLSREESYGYRIIRSVPEALELTESTLYPVLKRLEANGCVAVRAVDHKGRTRKYYRITEAGKARLAAFRAQRAQVVSVYDYIDGTETEKTKAGERTKNESSSVAPSIPVILQRVPVPTATLGVEFL